jgi:hypothetical protein
MASLHLRCFQCGAALAATILIAGTVAESYPCERCEAIRFAPEYRTALAPADSHVPEPEPSEPPGLRPVTMITTGSLSSGVSTATSLGVGSLTST